MLIICSVGRQEPSRAHFRAEKRAGTLAGIAFTQRIGAVSMKVTMARPAKTRFQDGTDSSARTTDAAHGIDVHAGIGRNGLGSFDPRPALTSVLPDLWGDVPRKEAGDTDDAERIHRLRVAIKRLRSAWRLSRRILLAGAADAERARLKSAAHALGSVREAQVVRGLLDAMLGHGRSSAVQPAVPRDGSASKVEKSALDAHQCLRSSVRKFLALAPAQAGQAPWIEALTKTYARARKRMPSSAGSKDAAFHAWRKAVKDLMYPLGAWPGLPVKRRNGMVQKLDQLQDRLGRAHDYAVLEATLERHPERGAAETPSQIIPVGSLRGKTLRKALRKAAAEKRSWKKKCLAKGRKLFEISPKKFRNKVLNPS